MNRHELAKKLAVEHKLPRAERYDVYLREYDNQVEVLGFMLDPTQDIKQYEGKEMLFPKRWVTIGVLDADTPVKI